MFFFIRSLNAALLQSYRSCILMSFSLPVERKREKRDKDREKEKLNGRDKQKLKIIVFICYYCFFFLKKGD